VGATQYVKGRVAKRQRKEGKRRDLGKA